MSKEKPGLLADLERVAGLLRRYRNVAQAETIEALIVLYADDRDAFWSELDRDRVWGSRSSVAERGLVDGCGVAPERHARDRTAFFRAMVAIAAEMDRRGINNRRAQLWAQRFSTADETGR